jgi:hypothetical protein
MVRSWRSRRCGCRRSSLPGVVEHAHIGSPPRVSACGSTGHRKANGSGPAESIGQIAAENSKLDALSSQPIELCPLCGDPGFLYLSNGECIPVSMSSALSAPARAPSRRCHSERRPNPWRVERCRQNSSTPLCKPRLDGGNCHSAPDTRRSAACADRRDLRAARTGAGSTTTRLARRDLGDPTISPPPKRSGHFYALIPHPSVGSLRTSPVAMPADPEAARLEIDIVPLQGPALPPDAAPGRERPAT